MVLMINYRRQMPLVKSLQMAMKEVYRALPCLRIGLVVSEGDLNLQKGVKTKSLFISDVHLSICLHRLECPFNGRCGVGPREAH